MNQRSGKWKKNAGAYQKFCIHVREKMEKEIVAWRKHPEPKGTIYSAGDLSRKEAVVALFVGSKASEAYINADGWQFLFEYYGIGGLHEIDTISGWLVVDDEGEWISRLVYFSLLAGYNPIDGEKGDYDPDSGKFISLEGFVKMIDWDAIHQMRLDGSSED
ncbi:hypothetical protein D770_10150 [Flammeovirgaceae bacterium 311]|nr:hypothetical protein D770_10150 [Flammeovirgaceae bacterium 311]